MKRIFSLSLFALATIALAAGGTTPSDIVKSPDKFDKKLIKVHGLVGKFKSRTSKAGNDYIVFELLSGSDKIAVYSHGRLDKDLHDGDKVEVEGFFTKIKTVGTMTFKNEIDCSGKKKGDKPKITVLK